MNNTATTKKKYKLAIIASHVIQYAVPLYKKISLHPDIDLTVFFCSRQGLSALLEDPGFGFKLQWDNLDLKGIKHRFLKNYSCCPNLNGFFGLINPGIIPELERNKYDAILVGGYSLCSYWLAFLGAFLTKTPLILSGEPPSLWKSRFRKITMGIVKKIFMPVLLKNVSAILYIGIKSKEYYLSFCKDIKEKMFFCPYSVDNDYYVGKEKEYAGRKKQLREELGIRTDYPVILFLSKMIKWKRPMFLLEVFSGLKYPAALVYVGSGSRHESLVKYVTHYGIKNVHFFGFKNYSQIPKFYFISDVFVLPSLGESWGLVVNEAMCFGLPVITTNKVMSAYDLVKDGENGYIIRAENKQELTNRLEYLLANPAQRQEMGEASKRIISNWNYDNWIGGLISALEFIKREKQK